jgi:polyisoprenoid-binding protein YceI
MRSKLQALLLLLLSAPVAIAAPVRYRIDPVHTQIVFTVEHAGFSKSVGKLLRPEGELQFDAKDPSNQQVEIRMQAVNVDMSDPAWNKAMQGKGYFNAKAFPEIRFRSTSVRATGESTYVLSGDLTLLGNIHAIEFPFTLNKRGKHPLTLKDTIGFSARTSVSRAALGLTAAKSMIGDQVEIWIEVEASQIYQVKPGGK